MKYRPKKWKTVVLVVLLPFALLAVFRLFGLGTIRSGWQLGYVSQEGWRNWDASYYLINGTMRHTLRPESAPAVLHVDVVTESGSLSIEIQDAAGEVLFTRDGLQTAGFDVEIPGKVSVLLTSDHHKGSFHMETG